MTAWSWTGVALAGWIGAAVWFALRLGPFLHRADPGETPTDYEEFEPLGLPVDVLGPMEIEFEFRRLTDPLEAEREQRLGGLW